MSGPQRSAPPLLLERDADLAALDEALGAAGRSRGSLVLVAGEAGIGKTALLRHFAEARPATRVLTGVCDPLETPRALSPLLDFAPDLGGDLQARLGGSPPRGDVFGSVAALLSGAGPAPVLVFEDIHWGDQATLDLLRFLGRRAERLRALLVATYREEEAPAGSPLAVLLGDLATAPGVRRLDLAPLSPEATARLAAGSNVAVEDLHRRTGGNPFYIVEVLAAGRSDVPATVRDAVLARVARLSPAGREALEAAAVVGTRVDPDVLGAVLDVTGTPRWGMRESAMAGLLVWRGPRLAFRHELTQAAVAAVTHPERRQRLHAVSLHIMRRGEVGPDDYAELVRHAEEASDDRAVVELAPLAAARAAALGAHREAAVLYGRALARAGGRASALYAGLTERQADEHYLSGRLDEAATGHLRAAAAWRGQGDRLSEGRNLARAAALTFLAGRYAEVEPAFEAAVACLEALPPGPELAMTYESRARLRFMALDPEDSVRWARRAADLADRVGSVETALNARVTEAAACLLGGDLAAREALVRERRRAVEEGLEDVAARAVLYLGWLPTLHRHYDGVDRHLDEGLAYAEDRELGYWQTLIRGARVQSALGQGRWHEVEELARAVLGHDQPVILSSLQALVAMGRLAARRGDARCWDHLDGAARMADLHPPAAAVVPVWPARAEAAWLAGDPERVLEEVRAGWRRPGASGVWAAGELTFWAHLAGGPAGPVGVPLAEPYRLVIVGEWARASTWWLDRGCRYDAALALASAADRRALLDALAIFDQLGARPAAAWARSRLRDIGVSAVPRGPRASTSASPVGLTLREREVLGLVAAGLTNAEIAGRLFLSGKTVDRHLSAILRKLDVASRSEAVAAARRLGGLAAPGLEEPSGRLSPRPRRIGARPSGTGT